VVTRGEVWWFEPPDDKARPVVVLARDVIAQRSGKITVAFVTSTVRGGATEVGLDHDDGMPRPCVVSLTNIETVFRGYLTRQIATLGPDRMAQVCEALKIAVAC
jgi:mRNA interferase MazF